jgi:P27 family predicted phage terminase small subunit
MRRGPAPKPTRLKAIAGNPGRRPLNNAEPEPQLIENLDSPVELDALGQKFWDYYAKLLQRCRVLSEADIHALAAAAQWWSVYQRAMSGLNDGVTQHSEANGNVARPEVMVAKSAFSCCWNLMQSFGLNPGDRSKLRALPLQKESPEDKYFGIRHGASRFLA